ncbi:MAG: PEGA domain-containing protein [bacterium]|nr:PEGA domain-containing protein [bacterium]
MIRPKARNRWRRGPVLALLVSVGIVGGCVRRTLTIQTEPAGALVFLNDEEIGRSPVTTDFTWYGDYDVIIRQPGYQTLKTHVKVVRPWYQYLPIDFVAEVLWPQHLVDAHAFDLTLTPVEPIDRADLVERAQALRERTLHEGE